MNKKENKIKYYYINKKSNLNEIDYTKIFKNLQILFHQNILNKNKEYINIRPNLIKSLLKYNNIYHYSKRVFYLGLLYIDIIFQSLPKNIILNEEYEIYIINSIVLAAKFYEIDIKSISFERFIEFNNNKFNLTIDDVALNEVNCLKILNYRLNYYSIYDILYLLMNEYINELSIKEDNEYNNSIFNYPFNILENIILSNITINYSYIDIAFSLLYKTKENFNINNECIEKINNKYDIKFINYKECLQNINDITDLKNKLYYLDFNYENKELKKNNIENNDENKKNIDINNIYKFIFNITNNSNKT